VGFCALARAFINMSCLRYVTSACRAPPPIGLVCATMKGTLHAQ
jgi:hypothetical protein